MIPVDYAQVTLNWTGAALPYGAATVFGVANTALALTAQGIANAVDTAIGSSAITDRLTNAVGITNIHVKLGPDATGAFYDKGVARVGGSAGDTNPATAILINKATGSGGRKNRGRMFIPGAIEGDVGQAGVLNSGPQGALQTQFSNFLAALGTASIPMVLLHDTALLPTVVTSLNVQSKLAVRHRRLRR